MDSFFTMDDLLQRKDIEGLKVMVRIDVNVSIDKTDDGDVVRDHEAARIRAMVPTIVALKKAKAKIILVAHLGKDGSQSLQPVVSYFKSLGVFMKTLSGWDRGVLAETVGGLKNSEAVILPNIRSHSGEKTNDKLFGKLLTSLCDVYVNDAFSVSHREHASVVGIGAFDKYIGLQLQKEIEMGEKIRKHSSKAVVVIAGAKFGTKLPLIKEFLKTGSFVFVGGALAHAIYKARGIEIGRSFFDNEVGVLDIVNNPKLLVADTVVSELPDGSSRILSVNDLTSDDMIVDVAPQSIEILRPVAMASEVVLWNGPLGWYEKGYTAGTSAMIRLLSQTAAETIVGGGDVVTVLEQLGATKNFDFVSTGGGALLDYLVDGSLVGLDLLKK